MSMTKAELEKMIETRDESLDALENEVERLSLIIDNDAECIISLENEVGHCRDGIEALTALVDAMTGTLRWITKEDQEYGD